jgi:hypothetical protein
LTGNLVFKQICRDDSDTGDSDIRHTADGFKAWQTPVEFSEEWRNHHVGKPLLGVRKN